MTLALLAVGLWLLVAALLGPVIAKGWGDE